MTLMYETWICARSKSLALDKQSTISWKTVCFFCVYHTKIRILNNIQGNLIFKVLSYQTYNFMKFLQKISLFLDLNHVEMHRNGFLESCPILLDSIESRQLSFDPPRVLFFSPKNWLIARSLILFIVEMDVFSTVNRFEWQIFKFHGVRRSVCQTSLFLTLCWQIPWTCQLFEILRFSSIWINKSGTAGERGIKRERKKEHMRMLN